MKPKQLPSHKKLSTKASFRSAFAQRLKDATRNRDIAELAAKIAVTPVTLYRWLNGKFDPSLPKLAELAEALSVNLAWLVTGTGPFDARQALRHALLQQYETTDFESAAGKPDKSPLAFYEPWLFELLYGPPQEPTVFGPTDMRSPLLMAVGEDSMEPTIAKGDLVLIDRSFGVRPTPLQPAQSQGRPAHDGIYACRSSSLQGNANDPTGHLMLRRIQYRLDGTMVVRCDNPRYPEEVYALKSQKLPVLVGRVVWCGSRM
jgi:phage repressor protein C with HTH and peptisase S24 domain